MYALDALVGGLLLIGMLQLVFGTMEWLFDRPWVLWSIVGTIAAVVYVSVKGLWPILYEYSQWAVVAPLAIMLGLGIVFWTWDLAKGAHKVLLRPLDQTKKEAIVSGTTTEAEPRSAGQFSNVPDTGSASFQDNALYQEHEQRHWTVFRAKERVINVKYGFGTVLETDGAMLIIQFDHAGVKRVADLHVDWLTR